MKSPKKVVVDSDAIFALYNPNDPLNPQATVTFKQLASQNFQLIYPASVLFEVISLFQRVLPKPKVTSRLIEMIRQDSLNIYPIDVEVVKDSALLFNPTGSKKNTLIDCSVVVIAKRIKANGVFAYDEFFAKQGLRPAEALV